MAFHRRRFLQASAAVAVLPTAALGQSLDALAEKARQAGEREVVIGGGAGAYAESVKKAFWDPFTEATGIKVTNVPGSYGEKLAKLKAMNTVGRVEWDAITLSVDGLTADTTAMLQDLGSCGALPNVAANGVEGACLRHGVLFDIGGGVLAFNHEVFPAGKPQPRGWADFWDVKSFPGPRALPNVGAPWWALAAALQADGVARDKLFPLDLDRAFRKLDEIKPHVTVWWRSGDQLQQILRSREVVMAMSFAGRAIGLAKAGQPISVVWDGAPLDASVWAVTRRAPRPNAALALLNFVYSRPEAHAQFGQASNGATAHKAALALMPAEEQRAQAVHPDHWSKIVRPDSDWLDTNREPLTRRWAEWLAR